MLTQNMLEVQAENRRAERAPKALLDVLQRVNKEDYENLIEWIFEFNESRQLSEQLTLEALLKSVDIYLPKTDYLVLETKVMRSLSFVFRYTSPNDYLDVFMERFPFFPKLRKAIPKFIQLALMRPYACQFKAEEIFFGAVLSIVQLQKPAMSQFQHRLLFSLTDCWQKARGVASIIAQAILVAQAGQNNC